MDAGALDRRVTIERAAVTQNELNEDLKTWEPVATVWASMKPVSDGERLRAGELSASRMVRFQIRWRADLRDVNPRDEVVFEGERYAIVGVKEIGRREGIELTCEGRAE